MFQSIPPGLKNLLILIGLFYFAQFAFERAQIDASVLYAFYPDSPSFRPWQIITHMFCHGSFTHLLFNAIALFTFGGVMESRLGTKRFLMLFFISGLGALLLHFISVGYMTYQQWNEFFPLHSGAVNSNMEDVDLYMHYFPVVGASGALYGVLVSFLFYYPNQELIFLFIPYPIKAKYLIPIIIGLDLFLALGNFSWDPIAHFAHLGGALTGFILVRYWSGRRLRNRWN